jgi:hypothetical protein
MKRYKLKASIVPTDPDFDEGSEWYIQIINDVQLSRLALRMAGGGLNEDQVADAMIKRLDLEQGRPVSYQDRQWCLESLPELN